MNAPGRHRILYFVGLLIVNLFTCVHSQGTGDVCFSLRNKTYQNNSNMIFPGAGDVWFSLNGTTYLNNSNVTLEDIGIGDNALLCRTNLTACCQNSENRPAIGNWYFPDGTRVPSAGAWWDFYRTRDQMVVLLHRRRGGVNGIYRCEIPDSINVTQSIYIGVYTAGTGVGDVWFSLRNEIFQNNSNVTLEDIGESNESALLCRTNLTACCKHPDIGNWFFPDRSRVPSDGSLNTTFTRTRDKMVLRLKHKGGGVEGIYRCEIPDSMNVTQTIYIGVYTSTASIPEETISSQTVGAITTTATVPVYSNTQPTISDRAITISVPLNSGVQPTTIPTKSGATTTTVPVSNITQFAGSVGETTTTVSVCLSTRPTRSDGATTTTTVPVSHSTRPTRSDGATTTTTVAVSHSTRATRSNGAITTTVLVISSIPPPNNSPSDGTTTTVVIIVVAVMIIVVIVVGVVILLVLFRAKNRKQHLEINKLQSVTTENIDIQMKLTSTTEIEASSSADQPPCEEIQTVAQPNKSNDLMEYLNQNSTFAGDYSEIELEPANGKHALPAKHPRHVSLSDPMSEEKQSSTMYHDIDQHSDPTSTTNMAQENDIYTEPDTASSPTVDTDSGTYETVYSEPIQPSLFTDAVGTPSDCEDLQHYAPIYTIPTDLPKSEQVRLKVVGGNIREIHKLGMGQFGKVILAETIGLSAKDLRLSESDDDKSRSTLVAVKKLRSDAPNATKEAFEKEVNFMSRLTDRNVIRILGVCYEDTPFIMMEYMEKGDLNHYLQKFKTLSIADSEPQGQITTSTLAHITTQIASAMKYLASHNFVHRDLATRNCLVGPNYLVKISDFGMSRSLYDSHYYRIHGRFALPVRWMSFECFYGKFSQKSDVWAFGVTMWEIFTLAKVQPYNDMSDKQVVEDALKGKNRTLLAKPNMCPLEVYKIMLECWAHNSKQRATFEKLFQLLTSDDIDQ